jgi:NADPH:quinone reductase
MGIGKERLFAMMLVLPLESIMSTAIPATALQLRSLVKPSGELELSLHSTPVPTPAADEVLIQVQASPLNPSDIGLLFGAADITTAKVSGSATSPTVTMQISPAAMKSMVGRMGQSMPVGNEGAGLVVGAGPSPAAQALVGKTVSVLGGAMYSQYRTVKADQCLVLPAGTTAAEGASCYVNPLTALGFIETLRHEGHKALVHTAAASNLGQMLIKICDQDNIGLVNIVRKPEHVALLKSLGAQYVCNAEAPTFMEDLTSALVATGATLAFDATGGGKLAGQILTCMEAALNQTSNEYSRYGSTTHKQVYLYGGLDTSPSTFQRSFGMAWGMGGWLVFSYLQKLGSGKMLQLKARIAAELKTTFASHYSREVSLAEALQPSEIAVYGQRATGTKYLINPNKA